MHKGPPVSQPGTQQGLMPTRGGLFPGILSEALFCVCRGLFASSAVLASAGGRGASNALDVAGPRSFVRQRKTFSLVNRNAADQGFWPQ